jgi:large subunit ribosomal protein L24
MSMEVPLKYADVRLVIAQADKETGVERDVIVRHLRGGAPHYEREYGSNIPRHTRYVAGEETEIPWPDPEIEERERQVEDTARRDVEDETYVPSIFQTPMPEGAENELIDPYDRLRKRHDTEYMTRKIVEDARSAWYEQRRLVTPKQLHLEKPPTMDARVEEARRDIWEVIRKEQLSAN